MPKVTFNNKNKVFYNALKLNVDQYFQINNINLPATGNYTAKHFCWFHRPSAIYILLLSVSMPAY